MRIKRSQTSLAGQVVAVNVLLVVATLFAASAAASLDLELDDQRIQFALLALTIILALLVNMMMLQRRFSPLEDLIERIEAIDPAHPSAFAAREGGTGADEVDRLAKSFQRLLARVEVERRRSGRLVLRAQEEERRRVARDLHDEVNQALTAILLRLSATIGDAPWGLRSELQETQELVSQAMNELLGLARQLRPTALDDHGLIAALASQVSDFGQRTGVQARFSHVGQVPQLSDEEQLVIFRVTQESLSNITKHARASDVSVELSFVGRTLLRVRDDGGGFDSSAGKRVNGRHRGRAGGLGLSGMRERALLVGGNLDVFTAPGAGTTIELTMGVS